jgi:protein-L-isoaspartate(D-aspartate) O-methyltransferase
MDERQAGRDETGATGAAVLRAALVDRLRREGFIQSAAVEAAFRAVPRHLFVPAVPLETAYSDVHVVTKEHDGQAISSSSQPSLMALMLDLLEARPGLRVLEIGAGPGYNAALLAELVGAAGEVTTVDLDNDIVEGAQAHLAAAGYERVRVVCGDGAEGYAAGAPYDRVILTVASSDIAPPWHDQLAPSGRLMLPLTIAPGLGGQYVVAFERAGDHLESVGACRCVFMPLRGMLAGALEARPPWTYPAVVDLTTDPARLRVRAYPRDVECAAGPDETVLERRWTRLVVSR